MRLGLLTLLAVGASVGSCARASDGPTRVGSKQFTESVLLAEIVTQHLNASGIPAVHERALGGTRILWSALGRNELDLYPEYSGTIREELLEGIADSPSALDSALAAQGVVRTVAFGFQNAYALGVLERFASTRNVATLSDLAKQPGLRFALSHEFIERRDGWPRVRAAYGFSSVDVRGMTHELAYRALASNQVDVVDLYTTDPEITRYQIRVLEDDKHALPPYDALLLARSAWANAHPDAVKALDALSGTLNAEQMRLLNGRVTHARETEAAVAAAFLAKNGTPQSSRSGDNRVARIWARTQEHSLLVGLSLLVATLVAVPLGVLCVRKKSLAQVVLTLTSVVQTVPSLALLVFLLPLFGIGEMPALAALFLYSLLPIVRNTHAGLTHLPLSLRESAHALGLPFFFQLFRIELPLASPSILAGIKTAAVINVGTATLGALIGAGGYGQPILQGIRLDSMPLILEGALPAALMALLVQALFDASERWLIPRGLRLRPR